MSITNVSIPPSSSVSAGNAAIIGVGLAIGVGVAFVTPPSLLKYIRKSKCPDDQEFQAECQEYLAANPPSSAPSSSSTKSLAAEFSSPKIEVETATRPVSEESFPQEAATRPGDESSERSYFGSEDGNYADDEISECQPSNASTPENQSIFSAFARSFSSTWSSSKQSLKSFVKRKSQRSPQAVADAAADILEQDKSQHQKFFSEREASPHIMTSSSEKIRKIDDKIRLFGGRTPSIRPRNSPGSQSTIDFRQIPGSTDEDDEAFGTRCTSRSVDLTPDDMTLTKEQQLGLLKAREFWKSKSSIQRQNSIVLSNRPIINFPVTPIRVIESETDMHVNALSPTNSDQSPQLIDKLRQNRASTFSSYGISGDYSRNRLTSFFMSMPPEYPLDYEDSTGMALYSYKEIVRRNYCKDFSGIDAKNLERYLTDEEFLNVFTMTKVNCYQPIRV
jgi:hypothetical protein